LKQDVTLALQHDLGLGELRLLSAMHAYGASAGSMLAYAAMAVRHGMATAIACVFADAPRRPRAAAGDAYGRGRAQAQSGFLGLRIAAGLGSPNVRYALAARRHMERYGTTSEQLGAIAVAQRAWAQLNPRAQMRSSLTLDDHQRSRPIAEPLRLLDCCLVSNGGAAVIVTSAERAAGLAQPPVHILGFGQGHPAQPLDDEWDFGLRSGAARSGATALAMAGLTIEDVDLLQLYDCYTFTVLLTLEDYGLCPKGEGGPFVAEGRTAPGGDVPVNTGGGQLSGFYLWGMTPLSEAVIQARGHAGARQVRKADVVLVSGNGGILDHHATVVLSRHAPTSTGAPR